ncbi:MAG: Na+/H+ antiporter subunit E [Clostridia bacterium]|nr:Na+/H+ antiporter subunit E [Clostridia bacterium]
MLLVLLALWIIFNGKFTLEILLFGLALSSAITWFCWKFMDYSFKAEKTALRLIPGALGYLWLLICEIVKSNLTLLGYVYGGKEVKPKLVTFRTPLRSRLARNVLSNSITLTPGTITAVQEGDKLTVHCLDAALAEGVEDQSFQRKLLGLEKTAEAGEKKEAQK